MSLIEEQLKTLLEAARFEVREEYRSKLVYVSAQVDQLRESLAGLIGDSSNKADVKASKAPVRRRSRKVDVKLSEEQIEAVASALGKVNELAKPTQLQKWFGEELGQGFNRKNIAAACRELVKAGRATEHRGRYQAVATRSESNAVDPNGMDHEASDEAAQ